MPIGAAPTKMETLFSITKMQNAPTSFEKTASLPFDPAKQEAILGHMLLDQQFFLQVRPQVPPRWFVDPRVSEIYTKLDNFYKEYGRFPKHIEEVKTQFSVFDQGERSKYQTKVDLCILQAGRIGLDVIRKEMTGWLRAGKMKDLLTEAARYYNGENLDMAYSWAEQKSKEIRECSFEADPAVSFEHPEDFLKKAESDREHTLTTGLPGFDQALLEGAADGGMLRGDMTVLLAPSNIGKTTTLSTIAVQNVWKRKHVLFFTHEGRPEDIQMKMLCSSMGVSMPELLAMYKTEEGLSKIRLHSKLLQTYMTYIPYNTAGSMYVEDVVDLMRSKQMDLKAKIGKGYDLVVSDYPQKLTSRLGKSLGDYRHIQTYVYDQYVQFALEEKLHALTAAQTNRDGSKTNQKSERFLTQDDVSECFGIMMIATNVVTINRSEEDKQKGLVTFYVAKSRSSITGTAVMCRSAYRCSRSHHESLGYTTAVTSVPIRDDVERLLAMSPELGTKG